jgi:hypothetical protein
VTAFADLTGQARELARALLAGRRQRWWHTAGVAARAAELAAALPAVDDRHTLVAAAWLHDIGYADQLRVTAFHPLDGARYLAAHCWPRRIAALVAHHSGARFVAAVVDLTGLLGVFEQEESAVSDALTYADQTVGPWGEPVSVDERLAEMLTRHGPGSPSAQANPLRAAYIRAAAARVERALPVRIPTQRQPGSAPPV